MGVWGRCVTSGLFLLLCCWGSLLPAQEATAQLSKKALEYRLEGFRYQEKGDLDQAITYYRKSVDEDANYATPHNDLGIVYEQKGLYEAAEREYLKALSINPDYKGAHSNLAYLYENKGDISKSIYYWKKRLMLEDNPSSDWSQKARQKVEELEQRRKVRGMMTEDQQQQLDSVRYEQKKKAEHKGWVPPSKDVNLEDELGARYFEKGVEFYNQRDYEKALAAFRMARTYDVNNKDIADYIVKTEKVRSAIQSSDVVHEEVFDDVVPQEDLKLSKDHFKMGLDYFTQQDFERAFSSFTMAMTYNPYDETIQKYVEDAKIKMEELKVRRKKLKEDADLKQSAKLREPKDVVKEMVTDKGDIMSKGFVTSMEDMSVEAFINDGKELFMRKRYADAIYVWKQAMLLDVTGLYRDEIESLLEQARVEDLKDQQKGMDRRSNVLDEEMLSDVNRASIPSATEGAPDWSVRAYDKVARTVDKGAVSADKQVILDKLNVRYTLNFKDANLKGVVNLLTELTELNIVIDTKEISKEDMELKNISFKVKDMPLIEILEAVLRFTDFDYLIEDNLIWITSKEKIRTEDVYMVVYDVQDIIGKMFDFPAEDLGHDFGRGQGSYSNRGRFGGEEFKA